MLRLVIIGAMLVAPGIALGSSEYQERSGFRVVGSSVIDEKTIKLMEESGDELQCYRSFQRHSLLRKVKCRTVKGQQEAIMAEKRAE